MVRPLRRLLGEIKPAKFRYILFAPRDARQHQVLQGQVDSLLPTRPAHIHVSDIDEVDKDFGLFPGLDVLLKRGFDPKKMVPHISIVAHFNRKAQGIDTFENLKQRGISQFLLVSGIAAGSDPTRKGLGDFYKSEMEEMVKNFSSEISENIAAFGMTCYSEIHPTTKQLVHPHVSRDELQQYEVENFQKKASWVLEGANRDDYKFLSCAVIQHSYDVAPPLAMAAKLREATGDYLQIIPSILPPYEAELVAGFCRHGFANLPSEVVEIADKIAFAETVEDRERALHRADKYTGNLVQKFAENFSELAFYPGKKITSAKQLANVIEILCECRILQPDLPATATESIEVKKFLQNSFSVSHA